MPLVRRYIFFQCLTRALSVGSNSLPAPQPSEMRKGTHPAPETSYPFECYNKDNYRKKCFIYCHIMIHFLYLRHLNLLCYCVSVTDIILVFDTFET